MTKKEHDDYETISSGTLCALCRSEAPASEGRVLGVIALVQSSRILGGTYIYSIVKFLRKFLQLQKAKILEVFK